MHGILQASTTSAPSDREDAGDGTRLAESLMVIETKQDIDILFDGA
jgi:hypothetical protein